MSQGWQKALTCVERPPESFEVPSGERVVAAEVHADGAAEMGVVEAGDGGLFSSLKAKGLRFLDTGRTLFFRPEEGVKSGA
jgi:hypothetical protein